MSCQNFSGQVQNERLCREVFERMNKTERFNSVQKQGRELISREISDHVICLYLLIDFFVEVWYESVSHRIDRIDVTTPDEIMSNYEEEIDLTGLF